MDSLNDDDWDYEPGSLPHWNFKEAQNHPLFMEELPANIEDNSYLMGIQAMLYDECTADDRILMFKTQGNNFYQEGNLRTSVLCYKKALEESDSELSDLKVKIQCHSNLALCYLKLKDYVRCVDQVNACLKLDGHQLKALIYGGQASLALGLPKRSLWFWDTALGLDPPARVSIQAERDKVQAVLDQRSLKKQTEEASLAETSRKQEKLIAAALDRRQIQIHPPVYDFSSYYPCELHYDEEEDLLTFPALFLIDEYQTSDCWEKLGEDLILSDVLDAMFPADSFAAWDARRDYVRANLHLFLETFSDGKMRLIKVDPSQKVGSLLAKRRVNQCLIFHAIPSSKVEDFLASSS